jgi:hypothetical protein
MTKTRRYHSLLLRLLLFPKFHFDLLFAVSRMVPILMFVLGDISWAGTDVELDAGSIVAAGECVDTVPDELAQDLRIAGVVEVEKMVMTEGVFPGMDVAAVVVVGLGVEVVVDTTVEGIASMLRVAVVVVVDVGKQ